MPVIAKNYATVIRSLQTTDARILDAAERGLAQALQGITFIVISKYLTGPRPERLGVVTGRLRGSIQHKIDRGPNGLIGRIGTNVPYGAYHEFGFTGTENVRGHTRGVRIGGQDTRRPIRDRQGNVVGHKETLRAANRNATNGPNREILVRSHQRRISYRGRPFLRPAVKDSLADVKRLVEEAIANAKP